MNESSNPLDELFERLEKLETKDSESKLIKNTENLDYQTKTDNFNQDMVNKYLVPELKDNEEQKRKLKPKLMNYIVWLIFIHSFIMLILLILLVCSATINMPVFKNIDIDIFKELSGFMKFFVTASLTEFIGMLLVIVHYIFDKSIVDLIKKFGSNDKKSSKKEKRNKIKELTQLYEKELLKYRRLLKNNYNNDTQKFLLDKHYDDNASEETQKDTNEAS